MNDTSDAIRNFGSICMPNYSWFGEIMRGRKFTLTIWIILTNWIIVTCGTLKWETYFNFQKKKKKKLKSIQLKLIYPFKGWKFTKYKLIYYPFKIKVIYYLPNKSIAFINIQERSNGSIYHSACRYFNNLLKRVSSYHIHFNSKN